MLFNVTEARIKAFEEMMGKHLMFHNLYSGYDCFTNVDKKYKCPAPKCSLNKKGFCCNHCKRTKHCLEVCKNDVNKCGAKALGA